jgi:hypothetical protein
MRKKRIGIKYCGECNPTYDVEVMVKDLEALVGENCLFVTSVEERLDGILLVSGCQKACTDEIPLLERGVPCRSLAGEVDLEELVRWIRNLR